MHVPRTATRGRTWMAAARAETIIETKRSCSPSCHCDLHVDTSVSHMVQIIELSCSCMQRRAQCPVMAKIVPGILFSVEELQEFQPLRIYHLAVIPNDSDSTSSIPYSGGSRRAIAALPQ